MWWMLYTKNSYTKILSRGVQVDPLSSAQMVVKSNLFLEVLKNFMVFVVVMIVKIIQYVQVQPLRRHLIS